MICPKSHSKDEGGSQMKAWRVSFCFCPPGICGLPQSIGAPSSWWGGGCAGISSSAHVTQAAPPHSPSPVAGSGVGTGDKQGQDRSWGRRGLSSVCWGG